MNRPYDIVIVGGGVVGAVSACALAQVLPEHQIALVESAYPPEHKNLERNAKNVNDFDARVSALNDASCAFLQGIGLWAALPKASIGVYERMVVWDGEGQGAVHFDCKDAHKDALGYIVENTLLQSVAWEQMNALSNVHIFSEETVLNCQQPPNQPIDITLSSGQTLQAPCLLAADGAQSSVRRFAGFAVQEKDMQQRAIVATVQTEHAHQSTAWQCFRHSGPLAFLPLASEQNQGHYSSVVWSLNTEEAVEHEALGDQAFSLALANAMEQSLGKVVAVSERKSVPLVQRHADAFVRGGTVLLGDAAYNIHPLAGQGMNLGLKDVAVLMREFVRAQHRKLPVYHPSVLARYQRQRVGESRAAAWSMSGFKQLFGLSHPAVLMGRNMGFKVVDRSPSLKRFFMRVANG